MRLVCAVLAIALVACDKPVEVEEARVEIEDSQDWKLALEVGFMPFGSDYRYTCNSAGEFTGEVRQPSSESADTKSTRLKLDESDVSRVYSEIKMLMVPAWVKDYDPEDVNPNLIISDGTAWKVSGEWNGEDFASQGWNAFPEVGRPAKATLEDRSVMALLKLMDGLAKKTSQQGAAGQPATTPRVRD
jgi:hypothetical protein